MNSRKFALIIANYDFEDRQLQKLTSPAKDAEALAKILEDKEIGEFDNINLQINKSADVLRKEISSFLSKKLPDDMLLLYYSGHGVVDSRSNLFLTTKETEMELLRATSVPASFIVEEMDESRSKRQILILDCCYSGSVIQGVKSGIGTKINAGIFEGNGYGRVFLSATDALELAWEGNRIIGNATVSLFTHYFIEGITTGNANPFREWISINDIYEYIYRKIVPHQNPQLSSFRQEGELIIARNPKPRVKIHTSITGIPSGKQEFVGDSSVFGIDFGTTKSAISIIRDGKPIIIRNDRGEKFTPSVVTFMENGKVAVGTSAIVQAFSNPNQAFFGVKRKIDQVIEFEYEGQKITHEDIASKIFESLKKSAKKYCTDDKYRAVICAPAYFTAKQKSAIVAAAIQAGFEVLRMIPEPVSAALAYGVDKNDVVVVCDLGGGTFDVSILDIGDRLADVISVNGDNSLGGLDFDDRVVNFLISNFFDKYGVDLSIDKVAKMRLMDAAEQAKVALSELDAVTVFVPNIYADQNGVKNIDVLLSREEFEVITEDLVDKIEKCCRAALADSWNKNINKVLLVGLSTQIPVIRKRVLDIFNISVDSNVDPSDAVAIGAAIQGGVLDGTIEDLLLLDAIPLSLGVETLGGVMSIVIERNTTIPTRKTQTCTTIVDNQTAVNIHVLQGENPMANENISIGRLRLDGILPAPSGTPQVDVTFDVDANSTLFVTAKDRVTGKEQKVTITTATKFVRSDNNSGSLLESEGIKIYPKEDIKPNLEGVKKLSEALGKSQSTKVDKEVNDNQ